MKKQLDIKRLILLNLPYVFAFYFVDKLASVFRLAPGTELVDKLTGGFANVGTAFANPLPSFFSSVFRRGHFSSLPSSSKAKIARSFAKGKNTAAPDGANRKTSSPIPMMTSITM